MMVCETGLGSRSQLPIGKVLTHGITFIKKNDTFNWMLLRTFYFSKTKKHKYMQK